MELRVKKNNMVTHKWVFTSFPAFILQMFKFLCVCGLAERKKVEPEDLEPPCLYPSQNPKHMKGKDERI